MTLSSKALGKLAGLAPARTDQVSVERNLPAKMDDGAVLLADRWFPSGPVAEVPTVLIRTPYGRRQMGMVGRLFAERGYQMVIQSVRGTFGSEGRFDPFRNERADGRATLDWVAGQPWFDGRLATFGPSYLGLTQWAVSEEAPAYLRAMALEVTASDFPGTVTYPGGSFALETGLAWIHQVSHQELSPLRVLRSQLATRRAVRKGARVLPLRDADLAAVGQHIDFFGDWLVHEEPGDPWWEPVIFGRRLEGTAPASLVGGWYDLFLPGQIADYRALRAAGREVRLCIGPWSHVSPGWSRRQPPRRPRVVRHPRGRADRPGPAAPGAGLRHGLPALGGTGRLAAADRPATLVSAPRGRARPPSTRCLLPRPLPLRPGRPHTRCRGTVTPRRQRRTEGPTPAGGPVRRVDLHE